MPKNRFEVISLDKSFYMKPDEYLNGWARKCGWKATLAYDSLWRHADRSREAYPSYKLMAEEHGVSEATIKRGVTVLEKFNIICKEQKKSSKGKFLHNTYLLLDKKHWQEPVGLVRPTDSRRSVENPSVGLYRPHKDTHKKDTHTLSIEKFSKIDDLGEQDLIEIANKYQVPLAFVRSKYDDMLLWAGERPGNAKVKGRNWKLTLMKWVKTDAIKIRLDANKYKKGGFVDASES